MFADIPTPLPPTVSVNFTSARAGAVMAIAMIPANITCFILSVPPRGLSQYSWAYLDFDDHAIVTAAVRGGDWCSADYASATSGNFLPFCPERIDRSRSDGFSYSCSAACCQRSLRSRWGHLSEPYNTDRRS